MCHVPCVMCHVSVVGGRAAGHRPVEHSDNLMPRVDIVLIGRTNEGQRWVLDSRLERNITHALPDAFDAVDAVELT